MEFIRRPFINGKTEDRLIGYGPSLKAVLDDDRHVKDKHDKIFSDLKRTWEALYTYIRRFEPILNCFSEDSRMNRDEIRNEKSKNIVTLNLKKLS